MKSNQEIINDARAVRDDGAQPRFEAADYEQVLLALARQDEGLAEDGIAQALARIAAGTNDEANALLFAADRKRDAEAAASVGKRAPVAKSAPSNVALDAVLADAERVSKSGSTPRYTRDAAESAMLELAKREAREGEGTAAAFARLCESDPRMNALYTLGQAAEDAEVAVVVAKSDPSDRFTPLLMQMAKYNRREGETIEAAASRLLQTDPVVMGAYAASQGS